MPSPACFNDRFPTCGRRRRGHGEGAFDTTLDKPYAQKMDLWQALVKGIARLTLLWTEEKALILTSPRAGRPRTSIYNRCCGKLRIRPEYVLMDSWNSSPPSAGFS